LEVHVSIGKRACTSVNETISSITYRLVHCSSTISTRVRKSKPATCIGKGFLITTKEITVSNII